MEEAMPDFIPDGDQVPYAVALIYSTGSSQRGTAKPNLPLMVKHRPDISLDNPDLMEQLRDALVDLVVYGRHAKTDGCNVFEELFPGFVGEHYLLREYDLNNGDLSLSRCTVETESFRPRSFQLSPQTPLARNICPSDVIPIIELYLKELTGDERHSKEPTEEMDMDDVAAASTSGSCVPRSTRQEFYDAIDLEKVQDLIDENETPEACPANDAEVKSVVSEELDVDAAHSLLKHVFGENVPLRGQFEWDSEEHFNQDWLAFMEEHLSHIMPMDVFEKKSIRSWFALKQNDQVPTISSFHCRHCRQHYDSMHLNPNRKSNFAKERGLMHREKYQNRFAILNHESSNGHLMVLQGLKKRAAEKIPNLLKDAQKKTLDDEGIDLAATMNHFRTVYIAICKHNVAFYAYEDLVLLQQLNGIDMGFNFANQFAAARMTDFISQDMHQTLVQHLISCGTDWALIVDETTDKSHKKYFAVLIQGIENYHSITYFYRSIEIRSIKVTAQDLFDALMAKFEEDGLKDVAKRHLVAFASDGAATMVARENGLAKKIDSFTDRPLYKVHCISHRIQLSLKEVTKKQRHHREMELLLNILYTFYGDHKKSVHYHQTGKYLGLKVLALKRIFDVRWVTSEVNVIDTFDRVWPILCTDLRTIRDDVNFDPRKLAQAKAGRLYTQITNRSVLQYMYFFRDMVAEIVAWTLKTQEHNAPLIEQIRYKNQITGELELMKTQNGKHMTEFFNALRCKVGQTTYAKDTPAGPCTEDHLYEAQEVTYKGHPLQPMKPANDLAAVGVGDEEEGNERRTISSLPGPRLLSLRLRDIREEILTELQSQIESYFPEQSIDSWSVFDPKRFPTDPHDFPTYGERDVKIVAKALGYETELEDIMEAWRHLMEVFLQNRWLCVPAMRVTDPGEFWTFVLKTYGPELEPDFPHLIRFLRHILVVPASSAAAERAFSSLKWFRHDRRSRLDARQVENLMRIKINGNPNPSAFAALKWAKKWTAAGHFRADERFTSERKDNERKRKGYKKDEDKKRSRNQSELF